MQVLIPNLGSTSLKFQLIDFPAENVLSRGRIERISQQGGGSGSYADAVAHVLERAGEPDAVGFKAVHAGPRYRGVFQIDDALIESLVLYADAAPLHNGIYLDGIRAFRARLPHLPLVAVLESGFHCTMPDYARTYGAPAGWRRDYGIERYGFHGASHRFVSERVPELLATGAEELRIVSCHLGGSSSICAIERGRSIDTTMGFSPQSGLENATRHGELDPFAVLFMMDRLEATPRQMRAMLVGEGGLAGISGVPGGDVRDLQEAAGRGDDAARLAMDTFAYQIRKTIGAYAAAMGGIDVVAFTGGIGENSALLRAQVCAGLDFLGIRLDPAANAAASGDRAIHHSSAATKIVVLNANEELIVGRETYRLLHPPA